MKKTLLALATLSAMAGSAFAADVTVYGLVDYGFQFKHVDQYTQTGDDNTFQMKSGMNSGSRFGLKGSEDLGNGLKVGFVLENGFSADDGTLDNGGRLFGRE
ncbi:porin, partial [Sutterella massiliensis]